MKIIVLIRRALLGIQTHFNLVLTYPILTKTRLVRSPLNRIVKPLKQNSYNERVDMIVFCSNAFYDTISITKAIEARAVRVLSGIPRGGGVCFCGGGCASVVRAVVSKQRRNDSIV